MSGKITDSDRQSFDTYAKRIGKANLISNFRQPSLSPQILFRLGQVQGSHGLLLPSLHHLRILNGWYLEHLELFLSPSLRTVEINAMRVDVSLSTILPFLANLRDVAPGLEALLLGPCELSLQVLNMCLQFKQLKCLELLGVGFSIPDTVLEEICSLAHLKKFVLQESRLSTWTATDTKPLISESESVTCGLNTLWITATSQLVEKVINRVNSPNLHELYLTFTEITNHPIVTSAKKKKKQLPVTPITHIIMRTVVERWEHSLVSLSIIAADTGRTESLPDDISLVNSGLKQLEIAGFEIYPLPSGEIHLDRPVDLEILNLSTTSFPLSRLQQIAVTCPKLRSLR